MGGAADQRVGFLSYYVEGAECEIAALVTSRRHGGIGTEILRELRQRLPERTTVCVVTTNDNVDALRFYQRRGFTLKALRAGAVDEARRSLKPSIPATGDFGIPLRDELELQARVDGLAL